MGRIVVRWCGNGNGSGVKGLVGFEWIRFVFV